jgi:hypothetical protein
MSCARMPSANSTPPRSGPAIVPIRPAPNAQPAPVERIAGGYIRLDSAMIPPWQPPPIPAPKMINESTQNNRGWNNPIESTQSAPKANPQVNTRSIPMRSTMDAVSKLHVITPRLYMLVPRMAREGLIPALCKMAGVHCRMK